MIKVLHISTAKSFRGAERIITQLCKANTETICNFLFCPIDAALKNKVDDTTIFYYKKRMGFDVLAAIKLNKIIKKEKINVLHIHDSHGLNLLQIINFLGNKTKAIVHRHVDFEIKHPKKYQQKNIAAIITVNKNSYDKLKQINNNTFLIYNGIDINIDEKQQKKKDTFVFVGSLSNEKNPLAFIEIISALHEQNPTVEAHIFGDGILKNSVLHAIQNKSFIQYHGFVENIDAAISPYEFLISTSTIEGFPLNILEAMSQKLLVIAPNINGINDVLNTENAILYKNTQDAIQQIGLMIHDISKKEKLIDNAFQTVQHYSNSKMILDIHKIYNKYI